MNSTTQSVWGSTNIQRHSSLNQGDNKALVGLQKKGKEVMNVVTQVETTHNLAGQRRQSQPMTVWPQNSSFSTDRE